MSACNSAHSRSRENGLDGSGSAWPSDDRNAVAFVDGNIPRRLEQDFPVLPLQRDDQKGSCGHGLELADGGPNALAARFRGDDLDFKTKTAQITAEPVEITGFNSRQQLGDVLIEQKLSHPF